MSSKNKKRHRDIADGKTFKDPAGKLSPQVFPRRIMAASIILIILLGFLGYGNSFSGKFLWDDQYLVVENTYLRAPSFIKNIFTENILGGTKRMTAFYRPLQVLTYAIDYAFWKLNPAGYHFSDVCWHVLAGVCFYLFILVVFDRQLMALAASLLFVIHPVHTEAVSYVSGRADPLVFVFIMLAMIFYIRRLHASRVTDYVLMVLSVSAALLSKEMGLILPLLILLYHGVFKEKVKIKDFVSVIVLAAAYLVVRSTVFKTHIAGVGVDTSLEQRLPGFFAALAGYLRLLVWPFGLHMEYGNVLFSYRDPNVWWGLAAFAGLLTWAVYSRRRDRIIFFSILWFFAGLLPVSNIFPLVTYMSEHWLYLPSVGFFLIVVRLLGFSSPKKPGLISFVAVGILLVFYTTLTFNQNRLWDKPVALYENMLTYAPKSVRLLNNLANIYAKEGKDREAQALYERAVSGNPDSAVSYFNFANFYKAKKETSQAVAMYRKAIDLDPTTIEAYNNLGATYAEAGSLDRAVAVYEQGAALGYHFPAIYENLANLYERMGRSGDAIPAYEKIVAFDPGRKDAYNNLGLAYSSVNRIDEAVASLKRAIDIDPRFAVAYKNLAVVYYKAGNYDLAIRFCDKALELGAKLAPDFLSALAPHRKT